MNLLWSWPQIGRRDPGADRLLSSLALSAPSDNPVSTISGTRRNAPETAPFVLRRRSFFRGDSLDRVVSLPVARWPSRCD